MSSDDYFSREQETEGKLREELHQTHQLLEEEGLSAFKIDDLGALIEKGLRAKSLYTETAAVIVDLLPHVVVDSAGAGWFEKISAAVGKRPVEGNNLFQDGFGKVIQDFIPLIGLYPGSTARRWRRSKR